MKNTFRRNGNEKNNGKNGNADAFDLSGYTTEEKLSWLGGYDLWNLRAVPHLAVNTTTNTPSSSPSNQKTSLCLSDGPHGLRKPINDLTLQEAHPATCFPSACSTACSWNPKLLETMGRALSKECDYYNVQVLLGPGVNLKRHLCGGRNHEYFSEDPYLAGILAKSYIGGVQESGTVGACIKHFALNNQESNRFVVDVKVDERTMRELYLPAFEHSLCSGNEDNGATVPKLVMAAYNKVNGKYCCEHDYLLGSVLRGEWKYDGVVVSDWGAIDNRAAAIKAGMDIEMPGTPAGCAFDGEVLEECISARESGGLEEEQPLTDSVRTTTTSSATNANHSTALETAIDECACRVVRLIDDLAPQRNTESGSNSSRELFEQHDRLAREIARECIVLLQNKDGFLPLSRDGVLERGSSSNPPKPTIGLVGDFARDSPRYQGMGSAHVTPTKLTSVYEAMESLLRGDDGSNDDDDGIAIPFAKGYDPDTDGDEVQQSLIDEAVAIAGLPDLDVLVVCIGLPEIAESEGFDRKNVHLPKQHVLLVEALTKAHPNVVVVLSNGGIVEIPQSFVEGAKAILDGFLLGQAGGSALVDVLFGVVSPSGRLPETIPITPDIDCPAANYFPGTREKVEYREGLDVGYRYYDTERIPVRFPFGHGLHYTTFEYSNLEVTIERDEKSSKRVKVSLEVSNTGQKGGASSSSSLSSSFSKPSMEVVQLYIQPIKPSVYRPLHELKGFSKVEMAPDATAKVEFVLDERAFSYYDIGWKDWVVEDDASFVLTIGASSRDIRLTETIRFGTGREVSRLAKESYPPLQTNRYKSLPSDPDRLLVDDETFAERFTGSQTDNSGIGIDIGSPLVEPTSSNGKKKNITRNTLMVDAASLSWIAKALMQISWIVAKREVKRGPTMKRELRMIRANIENVPLRALVVFSQGFLTFRTLDVMIHLMNGEFCRALRKIFRKQKN